MNSQIYKTGVIKELDADDMRVTARITRYGDVDREGDVISHGAIKNMADVSENGMPMLYQHDRMETIGTWRKVWEDGADVYGEGQISKAARRGPEIAGLIADGTIKGVSIGFSILSEKGAMRWMDDDQGIQFNAISLSEASIVTFPAHPKAELMRKDLADMIRLLSLKAQSPTKDWARIVRKHRRMRNG